MAFDAFLKIDGIDGESTDAAHPKEIEVLSFSFGVSNPTTIGSGSGGGGAGKASVSDFNFMSRLQKSSPVLFLACATGQHIKSALLSVRKAGGKSQDFYKVRLDDVLVSSFQESGSPSGADSVPTDSVSLSFAKIDIQYSVQDPRGALGESIEVSYDLVRNTDG
jgi:type VI secretion system secreted protein Hcp